MNREKFRWIQQKRSVLKTLMKQEHPDITQAGIGDDYSRLVLLGRQNGGNEMLGITEGLCLENALGYVTSDVIKQYNKLRAGGYEPFALTDTIMMPENDERKMKTILRELAELAKQLHVDIVYGHTEISDTFAKPAVTVTMFGKKYRENNLAEDDRKKRCQEKDLAEDGRRKIRPEMDIVMCGQTGILGTLLQVREKKEQLLTRYSEEYLRTAEAFDKLLLVKNQGILAEKCGAVYAHHISTGGVYAALWELAEAGSVGLEVLHDAIPIMQETIEICEFTGDNPYRIDGCGAILFVTEDGAALSDRLYQAGFEAAVIGKTTAGNDRVVLHDDERSFLTP